MGVLSDGDGDEDQENGMSEESSKIEGRGGGAARLIWKLVTKEKGAILNLSSFYTTSFLCLVWVSGTFHTRHWLYEA